VGVDDAHRARGALLDGGVAITGAEKAPGAALWATANRESLGLSQALSAAPRRHSYNSSGDAPW